MAGNKAPGLADTADPRQLIPGNPAQLRGYARGYAALGHKLDEAGTALRGLVLPDWHGPAAEGYQRYRDTASRRFFQASDAAAKTAKLFEHHAQVIEDCQTQARQAVRMRAQALKGHSSLVDGERDEQSWRSRLTLLRQAEATLTRARQVNTDAGKTTARAAANLQTHLPSRRLLAEFTPAQPFLPANTNTALPPGHPNTPAPHSGSPAGAPRALTPSGGPHPTPPPSSAPHSGATPLESHAQSHTPSGAPGPIHPGHPSSPGPGAPTSPAQATPTPPGPSRPHNQTHRPPRPTPAL